MWGILHSLPNSRDTQLRSNDESVVIVFPLKIRIATLPQNQPWCFVKLLHGLAASSLQFSWYQLEDIIQTANTAIEVDSSYPSS